MSEPRQNEIAKFDCPDDSWARVGKLQSRCVFIGPRNSPDAPVGIAIRADRDVGDLVAGKCSFPTTTAFIVLSGNVMHDGRWMAAGDIYVSPPDEMNGDLLFGPEGGVVFIMFNKRLGLIPTFANPKDQENFDRLLRQDVEDVAFGRTEKSVSLLPERTEFTPGRAITHFTIEEVEAYRRETGTEW